MGVLPFQGITILKDTKLNIKLPNLYMMPSRLWYPVQHNKNRWIKCPTKLNSVGFPHIAPVKVVCYLIERDPVTAKEFLNVGNINDKMSQTLTADTFSHLMETNGYKCRPHFMGGLHQRTPFLMYFILKCQTLKQFCIPATTPVFATTTVEI